MIIAYFSLTGNVRRFVESTGLPSVNITEVPKIEYPFIIVTPTYGFGEVPVQVSRFLQENSDHLRGVAVSGNRNWGESFGKAGERISELYSVPLLVKFELSGTRRDVETFTERVRLIGK
ncbi:class Ib ribonucleoside-diphosphate reductase assembly flavoprotein NrdI [Halalkalibacterium halodurans]|uniref:class Ib ribonucleoside-diphosphate reductase assembly flavoprotein NrdI n=1 Tax=Halalkalibacterium halodurans TaxID=86665 RepID=UPI002E1C2ED9|nr:class Ib ribonucleoside-diphosphate reductase assembly flavoprotein NrdI [Halalkalibacterium halodurans]MED4172601.1 class Ib ribonucleoside-diphosphate reductase assembly flavoprotein NrdI [Halalkalibacterium halodurans]